MISSSATVSHRSRFTRNGGNPAEFQQLPGVTRAEAQGERITLHTSDTDTTVRAFVRSNLSWKQLQVRTNNLEETFLQLVSQQECGVGSMKGYLNVELRRTLRDPFYIILAVVVPIGFYLLFAGLFGSSPHAPGTLSGNVGIMVAMAVYGGIWACLVATGPRIAIERSSGWMRNLRLLPISTWAVLSGRALVAVFFALPTMLLVYATAAVTHHVVLSPGQWLSMIALTWIGDVAIRSSGLGPGLSHQREFGVWRHLWYLHGDLRFGGLWVPPTILPANMLAIGKLYQPIRRRTLGGGSRWEMPQPWKVRLYSSGGASFCWLVVALFSSRAMKTR